MYSVITIVVGLVFMGSQVISVELLPVHAASLLASHRVVLFTLLWRIDSFIAERHGYVMACQRTVLTIRA